MFHICIALTSSNGKVHKVCPRNMFIYGQASVAALQRHPGACSSARPEGVRGCRPPQPLTTWCAVYTRPWYGMRIERLRGVENPSRRVTRANVAQQRPKMGHVKTTV